MAQQPIPAEIKAAALADLLAGEQPAIVAKRYGLNRTTVNSWKSRLTAFADASTAPLDASANAPGTTLVRQPTVEDRQARIGTLILELLEARLVASIAIAHHIQTNDTWINVQTASDLATLDGHLHTATVAVLDRLADSRRAADDLGDL
jgi:hypothetical protein